MIVRERPGLFRLFTIVRGSVIPRIFPQVLVVFALSALVIWAHRASPNLVPTVSSAPFALLGIAISIFLGFRNHACYDRWWEARKDWGQLVFTCRDFARQTLILETSAGEPGREARKHLLGLAIAFAHALVRHLRPDVDPSKVTSWLPQNLATAFTASRNPPDFILREIGGTLARLRGDETFTDIQFSMLDATVGRMSAILAASERILNTPVPFGYTLLLHRTAYIFCFLLPFGFADSLGWATPFVTALVAYTFFGLDALGDELEEPFGVLPNALPIGALAEVIEINLREALGETDLPALPRPKDYLLM
ncbi:bestrophin family protein [Rhizobiaceae bacterium n13]|uniref:Bestrophin family protein n=1 Tax=Ferirhizobium litorale TaxID=2927786 RepID=A0AAE3U5D9_9HYPH|nr:bestrophin family protein [Fererhizobium litorale]MDI7862868.1 bestrophin family protein [Fererhizobium litorale]MDI7923954.1 bestrophin family protein [Fererhizobium litorale]